MSESTTSKTWSTNYLFLLASIGSTVGLSNIWRFTYLAGENGGGAFVLIYILSLVVMGIPILTAELMIGRRGGKSMVGTLQALAKRDGISKSWKYFGWVSMIGVFLILSFYCVIAGWTLDYTITSLFGLLKNLDATTATEYYNNILDSPRSSTIAAEAIEARVTAASEARSPGSSSRRWVSVPSTSYQARMR